MPYRLSYQHIERIVDCPVGKYVVKESHREKDGAGSGQVVFFAAERVDERVEHNVVVEGLVNSNLQVQLIKTGRACTEDKEELENTVRQHYSFDEFSVAVFPFHDARAGFRGQILREAFRLFEYNQSATADALGLKRTAFQYQLNEYGERRAKGEKRKVLVKLTDFRTMVGSFERYLIEEAYQEGEMDVVKAAARLKLPRQTLSDRLRKYGISA